MRLGPDDQIVDPVAVDIPRTRHCLPESAADTAQPRADRPVQVGGDQRWREPRGSAVDDVGVACPKNLAGAGCANQNIVKAIAVDIPDAID